MFRNHISFVTDKVRNEKFYSALQSVIDSSSEVIDIGSGTGIWAVAAAMLGARHVTAIEREKDLIKIAKKTAKENNVQNKVEFILGDSRDISLDRKYDILVSETVGILGFDEEIISIMGDARNRFLKNNGVMIPSSCGLRAMLCYQQDLEFVTGIPINLNHFEEIVKHDFPRTGPFHKYEPITGCKPVSLFNVNLQTVSGDYKIPHVMAEWTLPKFPKDHLINAVALWANVKLTDSISFETKDTNTWTTCYLHFGPRKLSGNIKLEANLFGGNRWAKLQTHTEEFSISPSFIDLYEA